MNPSMNGWMNERMDDSMGERMNTWPVLRVLQRFGPEGSQINSHHLWSVDHFPQRPHEGAVHPHQLLRVHLRGEQDRIRSAQQSRLHRLALLVTLSPGRPCWGPRGSCRLVLWRLGWPRRTRLKCPVCERRRAEWSDPRAPRTNAAPPRSHNLHTGSSSFQNKVCTNDNTCLD